MNDGAVPVLSYRYRTKGQQWLWLETRFDMLNNGFNCKNYAIQAHSKVITLNEMLDSHEILDTMSSTTSFFDQSIPITKLVTTLPGQRKQYTPTEDSISSSPFANNKASAIWSQQHTDAVSAIFDGMSRNLSKFPENITIIETKDEIKS